MKYFILFFFFCSVLVQANNFGDGMHAYRKGNYHKAKILFEMALEKDKVFNASHMLGKMYLNGNGVAVNIDKAIDYFEFAYKFGNIMAGCYASKAYMQKGIYNWGILENGLAKGLEKKTRFCLKVVDIWQNQ